jgi:bifunctional DNA-binding transcriptional regulator/antitoxin component of YhaV-PrlF toxin-antitoxin module
MEEMNRIYAIVTHDKLPDDAAEAWKELNICAIGWDRYGNLKKAIPENLPSDVRNFLKIRKGDVILAYARANRISYVGEIVNGRYMHTHRNVVGRDEDYGGFEYPNQYEVKWWDRPYDFSRYDLPPFLYEQLGKKGRTVIPIEFHRRSFDEVKQIIVTNARSGSISYEINEDMIKAGIRKYLNRHLNSLEEGLKIVKSEKPTSKTDRPDFIAKDRLRQTVLIECKGTAYPEDCEQLERYGKNLTKENSRLMLVAFKITDECISIARKNPRMKLFECDLVFNKI